jgi:hypothetical protein
MKAFFVRTPRTVRDLRRPYLEESARVCEIVKTITLSHIAYENFEEDLTVDRQSIEDNVSRCSEVMSGNACSFTSADIRTASS